MGRIFNLSAAGSGCEAACLCITCWVCCKSIDFQATRYFTSWFWCARLWLVVLKKSRRVSHSFVSLLRRNEAHIWSVVTSMTEMVLFARYPTNSDLANLYYLPKFNFWKNVWRYYLKVQNHLCLTMLQVIVVVLRRIFNAPCSTFPDERNEFRELPPKLDQAFNEFSVYLIPQMRTFPEFDLSNCVKRENEIETAIM